MSCFISMPFFVKRNTFFSSGDQPIKGTQYHSLLRKPPTSAGLMLPWVRFL